MPANGLLSSRGTRFRYKTAAELSTKTAPENESTIDVSGIASVNDGGGLPLVYRSTGRAANSIASRNDLGVLYFLGPGTDDYFEPANVKTAIVLETVTAASQSLIAIGTSRIDSSSNAVAATLGNGYFEGQQKPVIFTDATNPSTLTVTNHSESSPKVYPLNAVGDTVILTWRGSDWATIYPASEIAMGMSRKEKVNAVDFSATPTIDMDAESGDIKSMILTADVTGAILVATRPGRYVLVLTQGGAGGHFFDIATTVVGTPRPIDMNAGFKSVLPLEYDGTTWFYL